MFVLVVTRQAATGELVRQTLGAEGWWVTAVADRETAVRSASDQAPQLVVIDGSVDEATEVVRFFASRHGGPGALLLASGNGTTGAAAADADAVLPREPEAEELAATARRLLKQPQSAPADALPTPGAVLNAQDIFGDLLAEMERGDGPGEPPPVPAVDTRPMVIPEPTVETVAEDPPPPLPSFETEGVAEDRDAGLERAEPATDPVPPREHAASPPPEKAAVAAPLLRQLVARQLSLPGGSRFWLGVAAGLLVFVAASLLLGWIFSPPAERPATVVVPAVDAVDLEELVDEEMAQREAELRESLLEEERRLQQQLDELTAGDG